MGSDVTLNGALMLERLNQRKTFKLKPYRIYLVVGNWSFRNSDSDF